MMRAAFPVLYSPLTRRRCERTCSLRAAFCLFSEAFERSGVGLDIGQRMTVRATH